MRTDPKGAVPRKKISATTEPIVLCKAPAHGRPAGSESPRERASARLPVSFAVILATSAWQPPPCHLPPGRRHRRERCATLKDHQRNGRSTAAIARWDPRGARGSVGPARLKITGKTAPAQDRAQQAHIGAGGKCAANHRRAGGMRHSWDESAHMPSLRDARIAADTTGAPAQRKA